MTADAVGGVWRYAVDLSTVLANAGIEVLLATLGPTPSADQLRSVAAIPGISTVHGEYALEWMQDPWRDVDASGQWLLDQQERFGADVIHLNGFSQASLKWNRPVVSVGHSDVRSWWRAVHNTEAGAEWDEYTRRVKAGLEAATCVIAPSSAMASCLAEEYATLPEKMRVIHNSTRIPEYDRKEKQAFILAAGRVWDRAKNFSLLAEIAPALDWTIRLAGGNDDPMAPTTDHIELLGNLPQEQMKEQLQRASILAHPALYEPFGLSVLEAARSRCCLVLGNIPSLRELWDGAAVFLDPRDPELWAFEINELCRDFPRRLKLGELAAVRARRYSADAMLKAYRDLYVSLLSGQTKEGVAA